MKPNRLYLLAAILFVFAGTVMSQTLTVDQKQDLSKPTPDQRLKNQQLDPAPEASATPPGPIHCIAEWEESEGILTLWKNADLMNKLQMDHLVYIPVDNYSEETTWVNWLNSNGIPLTNFSFLYIKTNTIWTRDYGPWFIWDANNEMGIVNYTCNYGPMDDLFPSYFARKYGILFYESGLYHVGGNYYPNAYGRAFSSTHVYESNPGKTKGDVDRLMEDYYGIDKYQTVAPKGIWHHDTWGKPANPETMIIVDFPEYDQNRHVQADGMVAYYSTLESPWGRPYKFHRLPMFPKTPGGMNYRPYMNSLVSNEQVFVPVHDCPDDPIALQVFEDAFVGYEVVGVIAKECSWPDALHCRTRNFMKRELIRMYPYPPGDTEETGSGYTVRAEVIPPNGSSLISGYPVIHWTQTGGAPFNDVVMTSTGQPGEYAGDIPAQSLGTTVSFYLETRDDGGLEAIYPLVAPEGMMSFNVRLDDEAPALSRHVPTRSAAAGQWPAQVRTLCKDDMATPEVRVEYAVNGVPQSDIHLTREDRCYWYSDHLGGNPSAGDLVTYRLVAGDGVHTSHLPKVGDYHCPVVDQGDVGVVNLCGRPYTAPFLVDALGDLGVSHHYYDAWPTDFGAHDAWFICLGVFADNHVLSSTEAGDIVSALQGGKHIYLEGGNTWCNDPQKETLKPWFGVLENHPWKSMNKASGIAGSIVEGISMYYVSEDLQMDAIQANPPAEQLFQCGSSKCRAVIHDAGSYRSIASTFALGGLMDKQWPETRKEILIRYLEFFGVDDFPLSVTPKGDYASLRLEGEAGDGYLLLGSLAESYVNTGYGAFRLDPGFMFYIDQGLIPSSGTVELLLRVPGEEEYHGFEVHFQAVVGQQLSPGKAVLTNRDILILVE